MASRSVIALFRDRQFEKPTYVRDFVRYGPWDDKRLPWRLLYRAKFVG